MSIKLEDYQDILAELGDKARDILEASWNEATRVFSPRGLQSYLEGAVSLKSLGRGTDLALSYIQEAPELARELGEDAASELLSTAIRMFSKTSATVVTSVVETAPTAARRLGDIDLFRAYLHLLDNLLAQAPRGVRPMLEKLDVLLEQLTLGGLRRWAMWGAQAYKNDFEGQIEYFGLNNEVSKGVLQRERKGTLFIEVQRRINIYLRALWGRDFFIRPTSGDFETREGYKPYIEGYIMHLPDAYDDHEGVSGLKIYRAAAAHCASHVVNTKTVFPGDSYNALQTALIGLFEDARVEYLTIKALPGLLQIWAPLHTADASLGEGMGALMTRLARRIIDANYHDDHPWVEQGYQAFMQMDPERYQDNMISVELGLVMAQAALEAGIAFSPSKDTVDIVYRDDNRYIWEYGEFDWHTSEQHEFLPQQVRRNATLIEMIHEIGVPGAGDDAQEIWTLTTEFFRDEESTSLNEQEGRPPISLPFHYAEWDYHMQLERPNWVTLLEKGAVGGDIELINKIVADNKPIISRLKYLIEALQPQGVQRIRKLEDGDEIDLNAAIRAMIEIRNGEMPDPRINMRNVRKVRDLSVLVLIDLSESTNELVRGSDKTVLDLAREATVLLADAMHKIGDPFAIHGFDSNGRHDVEYYRFKDFGEAYTDRAKAHLSNMKGQLSTRMGAAIRHAGHHLKSQPSNKKLLLVITDGEPADNDVRDPQYLRFDAKKAVEEVAKHGINTYCLSLDPHADDYVSRIFGARNYIVIDNVQRLPEKLPLLYVGLTQ